MNSVYFRRFKVFLIIAFFITLIAKSETKSMVLLFNEDEFVLALNSQEQVEIMSRLHTLILPSDSTKATVPYIPVSVLMPVNAEYQDIEVQYETITLMKDASLPDLPINTFGLPDNATVNSNIKNNSNATSKNDVVKFTGSDNINGYTIFHFLIRPFDYYNRTLFLNKNLKLNIKYQTGEHTDVRLPNRNIDLAKYVINPEDAVLYYNPAKINSQLRSDEDLFLEYAIITKREFAASFQPLIDWKNMKGVRTDMFFVEDIYAMYPNETSNQMKIKRFIYTLNRERNAMYILLGGDNSVIPAQTVYCEVITNNGKNKSYIPSDLFYASLSAPLNWDGNNNGKVGDLDDNIHFASSVYVARVPAKVAKAVDNFVNKIINYERFPDSKNWKNDLVMTGMNMFESDNNPAYNGRGTEIRGDKIYDEYIKPDWNGKLLKLYDKYSDFQWNGFYSSSIKNVISDGHSFMNILTHGSESYITTESADNLFGDELFYLNNPLPTILTSGACNICNLIIDDYSFGACAILSGTNNIISLYGATNSTLYRTNNSFIDVDGFPRYIGNFYKTIFTYKNDYNHLGASFADSKWDFIAGCNEYGHIRWNMLTANLFGDPEMPVYTSVPKEFGDIKIEILPQGSKFSITVNALVDDYLVGVSKYDGNNYNVMKSSYVSGSYKSTSFTTDDSTINICITKDGYVPYVIVFNPKCLYLQNETLSEGCVFMSPIIKTGADVTNLKGKGNVVFKGNSKGKYIFRANSIHIEAGTVFEMGAEVKMDYTSF